MYKEATNAGYRVYIVLYLLIWACDKHRPSKSVYSQQAWLQPASLLTATLSSCRTVCRRHDIFYLGYLLRLLKII